VTHLEFEPVGPALLPRSARWLDGLAAGCLILGLAIALAPGRVDLDLGWTTVSLGRAWPPLLVALLLASVRHVRHPRPHLGQRILAARRSLAAADVRLAIRMLLTTRLPVLLIGYAATLLVGLTTTVRYISEDPLSNLPSRWDAAWYMDIARVGYEFDSNGGPDRQQSIVFFPLYPMLTRTLAAFTTPDRTAQMQYQEFLEMRQVHIVWCGVLISLLAFAAATVVIFRWARLRADAETAAGTVALLAAYPFAVFYSAAYTESLFLLLAAGACYAFERGRLPLAGLAALLAGLTRPNGVMLCVPLGVLALAELRRRAPGWMARTGTRVMVAAMPAVGLALYCAFIYGLSGDPFAWVEAQTAWGRDRGATFAHYEWIWRTIQNEGLLAYVRMLPAEALQIPAVVFAIAMAWPVWRRLGPAYGLFVLANLLPPLLQGGLLSSGRFTGVLFPIFLALAQLVPAGRRTGWIVAFALGQGLIATLFFTGRPVY
jgi:hypothetical protein